MLRASGPMMLRGLIVAVVLAVGLVLAPVASATTPANPSLAGPPVSNSGSLSGVVSVAISGNYAYSPSYYSGVLTAVDISNPAAAFVAGPKRVVQRAAQRLDDQRRRWSRVSW